MENDFDYEDFFMGVVDNKKKTYLRTFDEDYRFKSLTKMVKMNSGKILDIGCGGGITTESFPYYYPKAKVFGCDVSKKAIEYARRLGSGKVTYAVIRGKKLPYKDNFFDVCVCMDVMEHIPNVDFFLKEVKRILKKNGRFFLLVPCEGESFTHTWLWQKLGIGNKMTFKRYGHIHPEFTHSYVQKLLRSHGFQIKKKYFSEHFIYQLISVCMYFIPLELMDALLGKKAVAYSDRGVVRAKMKKKKAIDPIMLWRNVWMKAIDGMRKLTSWEFDSLKETGFGAWKIHVLAVVKK